MTPPIIHPHWKVVAFNETHYWDTNVVAQAGELWGLYLFDGNRHTYCCELTPSYELWFIETVTTRTVPDDLDGDIRHWSNLNDQGCTYVHCSSMDRMDPKFIHDLGVRPLEEDQSYDDAQSSMFEYVQCNSRTPEGVPFECLS